MPKKIHSNKDLENLRKGLRNTLTPAEAYLWDFLKQKQLDGRKFRRQHSIGKYVVDFYCVEERLIIELDGQAHMNSTQIEYDEIRDKRLIELGNEVLRFENNMVFENLDSVLGEIRDHFKR